MTISLAHRRYVWLPDDEIEITPPGKTKLFDESKHPRDPKSGEFTETGGSGSDDAPKAPAAPKASDNAAVKAALGKDIAHPNLYSIREKIERGAWNLTVEKVKTDYRGTTTKIAINVPVPSNWVKHTKPYPSSGVEYYDPSKVVLDEDGRTAIKIDTEAAIPKKATPGVIYRGMSWEEYQGALENGHFKSRGDYNLGGAQVGLTYYSSDPGQAVSYAHSYAPSAYKATPGRPAVVVGVADPGDHYVVPQQPTELGIRTPVPTSAIREVYFGDPILAQPGDTEVIQESGRPPMEGSGMSPSVWVNWRKEGDDKVQATKEASRHHPGEGYTAEAYIANGIIHTDDVYDAARAIQEDRPVELDQPRTASLLITELGKISKNMIAHGEEAPTFNLCRVTIKGTSLFCADTQGIPRVKMPQIATGQEDAFRAYLEDKGHIVIEQQEYASYMHATQNELNGAKVAALAGKIREGKTGNPIFVSKDSYILDGHHRWAAEIGVDATDNVLGNDKTMAVHRVNISITQLLHEAELFTEGKGKISVHEAERRKKAWAVLKARSQALLRRFDPSQLRDELGRWADAGGSEDRVSTTVPSAAKQGFDPHQRQDLAPTYSAFKTALENPKYSKGVDKLMDKYGKAFLRLPEGASAAQKAEAFVEHAAANLTALYNAQDPELRGRSATWYRGARKIADDFSKQYGVSPRAVAGVMASLSPQRDWDQNVEMAKRVLDIAVVNGAIPIEGQKAARTKTAMLAYAKKQLAEADKIEAKLPDNANPKDPAIRGLLRKIENRRDTAAIMNDLAEKFEGKKLSEIPSRAEQAMVLRFYDEGNADPGRSYAIWNPEGTPSGQVAMAGKPGKEKVRKSGWGSFPMVANALSILGDDSRENISAALGDNHKIRNFYNNIISPEYGQDTTIDTHAVAAALLMPLGGGAPQVKEGLGMSPPSNAETGLKGVYALYSEAYRRAAKAAGILPREMQSTTWEALRGLFSPEEKRDAVLEAAVKNTWARYQKGTIDLAEAQREILARGIKPPRWAT